MRVVLIMMMMLAVVSCGKKGNLLPPAGYNTPGTEK